MSQWLRLHASNAGGLGSTPGQGTKTTHTVCPALKNFIKYPNHWFEVETNDFLHFYPPSLKSLPITWNQRQHVFQLLHIFSVLFIQWYKIRVPFYASLTWTSHTPSRTLPISGLRLSIYGASTQYINHLSRRKEIGCMENLVNTCISSNWSPIQSIPYSIASGLSKTNLIHSLA